MKIQDVIFLIIFFILLLFFRNKPKLFVCLALILLLLSMLLFGFWVFFTAQRFVYYAYVLLAVGVVIYAAHMFKKRL